MLSTLLSFGLKLPAVAYRFWTRPRLSMGDCRVLLNHEVQVERDEFSTEIIYGFDIQNCGRKAARSVRAYLVKKEARYKDDAEFGLVSAHTSLLPWYGAPSDDRAAVLVRGALRAVELDRWWEGEPGEDSGWGAAVQFRFTVAVVEDGDEQARKEFVIDNPWPEEPLPIEF
jgi:hypothetical protein